MRSGSTTISKPKTSDVHEDGERDTIEGAVENILYRSEETGYTVMQVKARGHDDAVTVVGRCAAAWGGEAVRAEGAWTRHPRHGYQFQADQVTCTPPTTAYGIERFLGSGLIQGVRREIARRIVEHFGDETLHVIEKESAKLEQVEGIGTVRRRMIKASWDENIAIRDIMIFLQSHGIGVAQATRIYKHYGADAVALVKSNPYRLAGDVWGIGFQTADQIAMSLGIDADSDIRARAGLLHVITVLSDEGHCFCPREDLVDAAQNLLGIDIDILERALDFCVEGRILIDEAGNIYSRELHEAERDVARRVVTLLETDPSFRPIVVDKALPWAQERMDVEFAPAQHDALAMAMGEKVSIITGGPGVGKTTIIRALVDVYRARALKLVLAAPTGRAAKRLNEATGYEAKTLHRTLKYRPEIHDFEHNEGTPLEADVLIIDEVSMLDIFLAASLFKALPDTTTVILVGDVDQLPSVGPGNVLRDLIASEAVPVTRLQTIFRQSDRSWIVHNAHRVNAGDAIELAGETEESDFYFIEGSDPEDVIRRMVDLVRRGIPQKFKHHPIMDIQVLSPMRRNQLGTVNLNGILQEALNPRGASIERFGRLYRERDRVMQMRNNYDKNVYNGDTGWIRRVDTDEQRVVIDFDGREIEYEFKELDEVELAYACSIHKSQGSEYPAVVILLTTQHYKLLQRNLLYTAITRGRHLVCIIGSEKAMRIATSNNEIVWRRTGLADRIRA